MPSDSSVNWWLGQENSIFIATILKTPRLISYQQQLHSQIWRLLRISLLLQVSHRIYFCLEKYLDINTYLQCNTFEFPFILNFCYIWKLKRPLWTRYTSCKSHTCGISTWLRYTWRTIDKRTVFLPLKNPCNSFHLAL